MGARDKTEEVLRDIHILLSQSEVYDATTGRIIVGKREMLELLQRLNSCIYEVMEEHEMTEQSRAAAEREMRRRTDEIVQDANRMAEDVYAGAVLYTDEALHRVQDIIRDAENALGDICAKLRDDLKKERESVHQNQSELKSNLEDLRDTDKYFKLIEDRNKQLAKEKEKGKGKGKDKREEKEPSLYAAVKPEIRINAEYFEKAGIPLIEDEPEEQPEEITESVQAEIKVNLDAEYFKWKEESTENTSEEKKPEKHSLFGKIKKSDS